MTTNEQHRLALLAAARLVLQMPAESTWSICITDYDDPESPGVFNIFVKTEAERVRMRTMLGFGRPYDEGDRHESHKYQGTLLVSIIEPEEDHESAGR
jgi:hypothetical protein